MANEITPWIPPLPREEDGTIRMSGITTRIIDASIQTLFKKGYVEVRDHHSDKANNEYIGHKTMFRLQSEHGHFTDAHVEVSINSEGVYCIYLVKEKEIEDEQM